MKVPGFRGLCRGAAVFGRLRRDARGVTAIVTGLAATVLMGFAGLAIDVAYWEMSGRRMQGAADEAALASSGLSVTGTSAETVSLAKAVAASHGYVDGQNGVTVTVNTGYDIGSKSGLCKSSNSGGYTCVAIAKTQPQYFTRPFLSSAPTVTVSAVAKPPGQPTNGQMCVMALDETGKLAIQSEDFPSKTTVTLNCDIYNDSPNIDSTQLSGSAYVTVNNMYLAGNYEKDSNSTLTVNGVLATYVQPSPDPYAGLSIPSFSGCAQGKLSGGSAWSPSSSQTLTPIGSTPYVICGGLTVNNGVILTLGAGTYIVDSGNLTVNGGGTLTGTGATIILSSSTGSSSIGTIGFNGGATVALTAPTTGASAGVPGVAIWVDKNATSGATDTFNGGTTENINGAIYLPSHQVNYAGGSATGIGNGVTKCAQLIALTVTFSGDAYLTHAYCASMNLPVKDPLAPPLLTQ